LRRGGRWNSPGVSVLYAASSISLACLEILVHLRDTAILPEFVYSEIEIADSLVRPWNVGALRAEAILGSTVLSREFGDSWSKLDPKIGAGDFPAQQVPSAVVPMEWNYLVNPTHKKFPALTWPDPRIFRIDPRLINPTLR
jgi:RES domain-containing protein